MTFDFTTLCRGSAGASAIRRAGGHSLEIIEDPQNEPRILCKWPNGVSGPSPELLAKMGEVKHDTIAFLRKEIADAELGHEDADQDLAVALASAYIDGNLPSDPFNHHEPIGLTGGAGYGKTFTIGRIIKETSAQNIIVVAPTNAACAVLRRQFKAQGVFTGGKQVNVATTHKAFKTLVLTPQGHTAFDSVLNIVGLPQDIEIWCDASGLLPDSASTAAAALDAQDLADVIKKLKSGKSPVRQLQRISTAIGNAVQAARKANFAFLAMRALSTAGFKNLDPRLCFWRVEPPGQGTLVIIDEVGMVGCVLVRQLLQNGAQVILAGDPYQLPPVSTEFVDSNGNICRDKSAVLMLPLDRTVHLQRSRRTVDSPIPDLAAKVFYAPSQEHMAQAIRYAAEAFPDKITIIGNIGQAPLEAFDQGPFVCHTNARRLEAMQVIRRYQGRSAREMEVGEFLICHSPEGVEQGQESAIRKNELYRITDILPTGPGDMQFLYDLQPLSECEEGEIVSTFIYFGDPTCDERTFNAQKSRWLDGISNVEDNVRGACYSDDLPWMGPASGVSVYKAQGNEWPVVVIDAENIFTATRPDPLPLPDGRTVESWRRLLYVALTRTSDRLFIILKS